MTAEERYYGWPLIDASGFRTSFTSDEAFARFEDAYRNLHELFRDWDRKLNPMVKPNASHQ